MFISIIFVETSIDKTYNTHQKVVGSIFMFKVSTIHRNRALKRVRRCAITAITAALTEWSSSLTRSFNTHIMGPLMADPLFEDAPADAAVHWSQIKFELGGHISRRLNSGISSLCNNVTLSLARDFHIGRQSRVISLTATLSK